MNCRGREKHSATLDYVPFHFFRALAASGVLQTERNTIKSLSAPQLATYNHTYYWNDVNNVKLLIELHVH